MAFRGCMVMKKAAQIAAHLNAFNAERAFDYRLTAEAKASEIGVGLYWFGTAESASRYPDAEVWQIQRGTWSRKLGEFMLGHDGVWRAR